jgi:hypothetical protein
VICICFFRFSLDDNLAYDEMFEYSPTAGRLQLLRAIFQFNPNEDPLSARYAQLWPHFKKLLDSMIIASRIDTGWREGRALLCFKKPDWAFPRPSLEHIAQLCSTLELPATDKNTFATAINLWPGDASKEQDALMKDEDEDDEDI